MQDNLIAEFLQKGCKSDKEAAIATKVYLELSLVKKYVDIESHYHSTLEKFYFTARRKENEELSIFIPTPVYETLSFVHLQKFFKLNDTIKSIYIAIVHSDSTCLCYQIFDGLSEISCSTKKTSSAQASQKPAIVTPEEVSTDIASDSNVKDCK